MARRKQIDADIVFRSFARARRGRLLRRFLFLCCVNGEELFERRRRENRAEDGVECDRARALNRGELLPDDDVFGDAFEDAGCIRARRGRRHHRRIRSDILERRHRHVLKHAGCRHGVAADALLRVDRCSARHFRRVERGKRIGPPRRTERRETVFDVEEIQPLRRRRVIPMKEARLADVDIGEDAEDFADVAGEPQDRVLVRRRAVPLHDVVPRGVPQKRIADRRVRRLAVARDLEIDRRDAIEDRAECVGACESPLRCRGRVGDELREVVAELLQIGEE